MNSHFNVALWVGNDGAHDDKEVDHYSNKRGIEGTYIASSYTFGIKYAMMVETVDAYLAVIAVFHVFC